jgi:DNA-binding transcriptional LysR family regulator
VRFTLRSGGYETVLRELRQGDLDIALAVSASNPVLDARHHWTEQLAWVRGAADQIGCINPVPFVSYGEECAFYRIAMAALNAAGQSCDVVFTAPSLAHLMGAVASGLGVMVLPRKRVPNQLVIWDDGPLPPLPAMFCGIFVREGGDRELLGQLAESMAGTLNSIQSA